MVGAVGYLCEQASGRCLYGREPFSGGGITIGAIDDELLWHLEKLLYRCVYAIVLD